MSDLLSVCPPFDARTHRMADTYTETMDEAGRTVRIYDIEPLPPPAAVSLFQARAALMEAGLFDAADAAVQAQGGVALQAWEYATEVRRDSALVNAMAPALGLSDAQVDDLFRQAAMIEA